MSEQGYQMTGLILRLPKGWHFRVWKNGFEYGNRLGGRVFFFPWFKPRKLSPAKAASNAAGGEA